MSYKNYSFLKNLILEEIQVHRSTLEMSQLMGFKFDKYRRWKHNSKILKWNEFEFLCKTMGLNLEFALEVLSKSNVSYNKSENLFYYLKDFNNFETNQQMADYLKCHVSVIKRYTTNKTIPDVETILKLIDLKPNLLFLFVSRLIPRKLESKTLQLWLDSESKKSNDEVIDIIHHAGSEILKIVGSNDDLEKSIRDILFQTVNLILEDDSKYTA